MPVSPARTTRRITIETLRTAVLVAGVLLVAAILIFLAIGQWHLRLTSKDIPKRLGIDIQQQADGVDYTQTRKGKTIFKIHAARAVQLKKDGKTLLHDVRIELFGEDGSRTDTISGSEFDYDPGAGQARAAGPVEITLMRPNVRPAIADAMPGMPKTVKLPPTLERPVTDGQIHVKTSGLLFDQRTGIASTAERVDFALSQGSGNSVGAVYDSGKGQLVLDHQVELQIKRLQGSVTIHASHAEFERGDELCTLNQANAEYTGGSAKADQARVYFRPDGTVDHLDGTGSLILQSASGGQIAAPRGSLEFDSANHPRRGLLQGGTQFSSTAPDRRLEGSAPTARLIFDHDGQLHLAHLEQGVNFVSLDQRKTSSGAPMQVRRNWKSQFADIEFATAPVPSRNASGKSGPIEARRIHGTGGVNLLSESIAGGVKTPSRLSADDVVADLDPGESITRLTATGNVHFEEQAVGGVLQSTSSDTFVANLQPLDKLKPPPAGMGGKQARNGETTEIQSILQTGHVVLIQKSPGNLSRGSAESETRATASRSDYDGLTQVLRLTGNPRIQDAAVDLSANRIDLARTSGDASAHGDVKAVWSQRPQPGTPVSGISIPGSALLAQGNSPASGPVHAVATDAELHRESHDLILRSGAAGNPARLWQGANSIEAPVITLNRLRETLLAESRGSGALVHTVMVRSAEPSTAQTSKAAQPSVIRITSGDLRYSEGDRLATFHASPAASVIAETAGAGGAATIRSKTAEVFLLPAGVRPLTRQPQIPPGQGSGSSAEPRSAGIDHLVAQGQVSVDWPGRKGSGEKLLYLGSDETYTLTGTPSLPPRIIDEARGVVTGRTLIFRTRDDSVTVEGDGGKTVTETRTKR